MNSPPVPPRRIPERDKALRAPADVARPQDGQRDLLAKLASPAEEVARDAMARLRRPDYQGTAGVELVTALAVFLAESGLLPKRAQAERLRMMLRGLKIGGSDIQSLAEAAHEFPAHLRVTAAEFVPAHIRPSIYEPPLHQLGETAETQVRADPATSDPTDAQEHPPPTAPVVDLDAIPGDRPRAYSTVLLLSHPDRSEGNTRLLRAADVDFEPIVVESLDVLRQCLTTNTDVCACVVDQSFLQAIDEGDQLSLFEELAGYSTFIRLRIHDVGELRVARDDILQVIKRSRGLGTEVPATAVSFQSDGALRSSELDDFRRTGELLRSHESSIFVLGELSAAEGRLLVAAARARIQADRLDGVAEVRSLTTHFLGGGRSGARLATVRVNGGSRAFVAKITTKRYALEEIQRFRLFIQDWDPQLQPEAYFHGNEAVILFELVQGGDQYAPADMLEDRIIALWNDQWMGAIDPAELRDRAEAMGRGLERAARELANLNSIEPVLSSFTSFVNPEVGRIEALEAQGFDCGLDSISLIARSKAARRYERLEQAAVVHGDVHLRNMLVRGDGDIHLIDFAQSGPGHPALDLVRLELALYLGPVRHFEPEARCVEFQHELSIERTSLGGLRERFPSFFQCHVNAACARGMIASRDRAIDALRAHHGDSSDYLAAKYLLAWQHLGLIGSHTALARAVIMALAPEIASW
jgi:phosphotransferase family enzyme